MNKNVLIMTISLGFLFVLNAFGEPYYVGLSGAPGTNGTCAISCHGTSGGTIQIEGFPSEYSPGEEYTITISHSGGNTIRQFNGSCRIGSGSENAGVISAGMNTATYNTTHETNGIHFSSSSQNSGTFTWTAPPQGVGEIRLYIAGLQGGHNGNNTTLVIPSHEQTTVIEDVDPAMPVFIELSQNYPNPFNASTTIEFTVLESQNVNLGIYDLLGRRVGNLLDEYWQAGHHAVIFDASGLSSGVYLYQLQAGNLVETKKMLLLR